MKVWVLSTCIPDENEPCLPSVFATQEAADTQFAEFMRSEWEHNGAEDEDGKRKPFPDDPNEAHDIMSENNPDWGRYEISCHEIEAQFPPILITENRDGVKPGFYTRPDIVRLLKLHAKNPNGIALIASAMDNKETNP